MNSYQQRLRKYNDFKATYIRNGMNGEVLTQALRNLADRLKI
jgi:hypothetical protein